MYFTPSDSSSKSLLYTTVGENGTKCKLKLRFVPFLGFCTDIDKGSFVSVELGFFERGQSVGNRGVHYTRKFVVSF